MSGPHDNMSEMPKKETCAGNTVRKNIYQIHTQPMIFAAMILVLTVGHLIVDKLSYF
jgi:hypothetical protein